MGRAFATRLAAGHDGTITAKNPAHAEQAAAAAGGNARAVPRHEIARDAEVLILATYYHDAPDALRAAGDLAGKTVIDITNPLTPDTSPAAAPASPPPGSPSGNGPRNGPRPQVPAYRLARDDHGAPRADHSGATHHASSP